MEYMTSQNLRFISTENGKYFVLKHKPVKPATNFDLLKVVQFRFFRKHNIEINEQLWASYEQCFSECSAELTSRKTELVLTENKPIEAMF